MRPLAHGLTVWKDLSRRSRWRWALLLAGAIVALAFAAWRVDWRAVQHVLEELNPLLLVAAMAVLPLAGFSIAVVYLIAGARFGPAVGGAVVAGVTLVHLAASHWIARGLLRARLERMIRRRGHRLPRVAPGADAAVAAIGALVPGPPYVLRNYLLGLSGVRLRVLLLVCLPIYVARSYLVIFLGDLTDEWSLRSFLIIAAVFVAKLAICALLLRHLRRRYVVRA